MVVQNIECQLTQVQLKRFLEGDDLPQELLDDLENHLKSCRSCMAVAQGQRSALEDQLTQKTSNPLSAITGLFKAAVTPRPAALETAIDPSQAILSQPGVDGSAISSLEIITQPKNLMLICGLAIVIGLMMTILRNPTHLLGPKASETVKTPAGIEPTENPDSTVAAVASLQGAEAQPSLVGMTAAKLKPGLPSPNVETAVASLTDTAPDQSAAKPAETPAPDLVKPVPTPPTTNKAAPDKTQISPPKEITAKGEIAQSVPGEPTLTDSKIISVGDDEPQIKPHAKPHFSKVTPHARSGKRPQTPTRHHQSAVKQRARTQGASKKRKTTKAKKRAPARDSGGTGVRVYDNNGKPLGG